MIKNRNWRMRQSGWFDVAMLLLLIAVALFILGAVWQPGEREISPESNGLYANEYDLQNIQYLQRTEPERPAYYLYGAVFFAAAVALLICIGIITPWIHNSSGRTRRARRTASFFRFLLCLMITAIMVFPVYWMIVTSLLTSEELLQTPPAFYPSELSFDNYRRMLQNASFQQYIINTVIVTGFILLGEMTIGTLAAYGFSKGNFKGKNGLFMLVLGAIAIPAQATYVPLYMIALNLNWINTFHGLILPYLVSGLFILIVRNAFLSVDESYVEAAKIDGMGRIRTISHVLIPMCKPTFTAACILTLVKGWNNYYWPKLITTNEKTRTIAIGIQYLRRSSSGMETLNYNEILAGAVLATLPVILLFALFQRCFTVYLKKPSIRANEENIAQ